MRGRRASGAHWWESGAHYQSGSNARRGKWKESSLSLGEVYEPALADRMERTPTHLDIAVPDPEPRLRKDISPGAHLAQRTNSLAPRE